MSVRPTIFHPDGSVDVVYDEQGHSGTIPAGEVVWTAGVDGNPNHNFIILHCPDGCGAASTHPVGGGADPPNVQQLFVHKTERDGCACGQIAADDTTSVPESHVRLNCNRMDGPGRWQLDTPVQLEVRAQAPNMFQVVYRRTDRLIIGLEPSGGVGPQNGVAVIHDMTEYEVLMRTDPAYLSSDGEHIVGSPP
jgi:hypothetical protein